MNVSEVINFKIDLEKGRYISAIELIEIVESFNKGIEPKDLVNFLDTLDIFSMRLHSFNEYNGLIHYGHPDFDKKIGAKIADFLYLRENHVKDGTHDVYASKLSHLETVCWHRVDLLRVEGFVDNTDIVSWGKKHILQRIYNDMTGEHFDVITTFTKNAQQKIFKMLGRTPLDNNTSGHTQAQIAQLTTNNEKAQAKIADLEKQLSKANAELAAAKTATTAQPIDWQSIGKNENIYPPELHLALMIWQRIYVDNELKEKHIPSHNGKASAIARKIGLNPKSTLFNRVAMIINTAKSKNEQASLAEPLRAIEQLYMPPKKEKTTS